MSAQPDSSKASSVKHGSHGGPLVAIETGYVELSVFETGVPPIFRLYFSNREQIPQRPLNAAEVKLVTARPDGRSQNFDFRAADDYLESTSDIPEPHEFVATVAIAHNGHEHRYETQFTEADHGHAHGDEAHGDHAHGAGAHEHGEHDHAHGSGILGWFRSTFAHSHSVTEKVDSTMESSECGIRALKISLVGLGLTALFQLIIVLLSGSIALLADTIHNFADAGTSIPLWIAFSLARRGASRRYTYGYGKTEDVAGVVIVLIIFFSACVAAYEAAMKIIHPQPMIHLWWVAAAAVVGFIGNEAVAVFRIRVGKQIGSAALVADGQHARVDGFTSLSVLLGVFGVLLGFPIIDPIVGVGISIAILFIVKDAAKAIWIRLIDGIEPEILSEIEHAPTHIPGVLGVRDVRARWVGHKVYTDVAINVDPQLSVRDADLIASKVEQALREHVRLLGHAVVRVSPAIVVAG